MMTRNLGVDINIKASRGNYQVKLMRENFALNAHKSLLHILRDICNGCRNGYKGGSFLLAREKQIKYIIFGDSKIEESLYKKTIFDRIARGKTDKLHDACLHPWNFIKRHYYDYRLRGEFPLTREEQAGSAVIHFFDYEPWDEDVIIQTITQEDGWSSGHEHATWRIDCKVHLIADYLTLSELGFNEKDEILSKLVREGKISREHALERLANLRQDSIKSLSKLDDVFQEYNLNRDILDKLLQKMD